MAYDLIRKPKSKDWSILRLFDRSPNDNTKSTKMQRIPRHWWKCLEDDWLSKPLNNSAKMGRLDATWLDNKYSYFFVCYDFCPQFFCPRRKTRLKKRSIEPGGKSMFVMLWQIMKTLQKGAWWGAVKSWWTEETPSANVFWKIVCFNLLFFVFTFVFWEVCYWPDCNFYNVC